jgi:hypothetical protein
MNKTVNESALNEPVATAAAAERPAGSSAARVVFLDGVRGWASLMVVLSHLLPCFLAITTPAYRHWYLTFVSDGNFAVYIFFVLSGFALSCKPEIRAFRWSWPCGAIPD